MFHSNHGCSNQCILSGKAFGRNAGALLQVKTYTPATIAIYLSGPSGGIAQFSSDEGVTSFSRHIPQLDAGTTYEVMVQARDDYGTAIALGEFTTLSRLLEISFLQPAEIYYNEFNDSGPYSTAVWFNDGWSPGTYEEDLSTTGSDPWVLEPFSNMVSTQTPVDRYITSLIVQLEMFRSASDCGPIYCQWVPDITDWDYPRYGTVDDSGKYFSYSELNDGEPFDLDDRPSDATSWVEHTFSVVLRPPHYDLPIPYFAFNVEANIRVMYVQW